MNCYRICTLPWSSLLPWLCRNSRLTGNWKHDSPIIRFPSPIFGCMNFPWIFPILSQSFNLRKMSKQSIFSQHFEGLTPWAGTWWTCRDQLGEFGRRSAVLRYAAVFSLWHGKVLHNSQSFAKFRGFYIMPTSCVCPRKTSCAFNSTCSIITGNCETSQDWWSSWWWVQGLRKGNQSLAFWNTESPNGKWWLVE